jgi:hypothetical protein
MRVASVIRKRVSREGTKEDRRKAGRWGVDSGPAADRRAGMGVDMSSGVGEA